MFFDILVFIIILLGVFYGFKEGFLKKGLGIATWLGAIYISYTFVHQFKPHVDQLVSDETTSIVASYVTLFVISFIFLGILKQILLSVIKVDSLKVPDQILGSILGLFEGIALSILCYLSIGAFLPQNIQPERSKPLLKRASLIVIGQLPLVQRMGAQNYLSKNHPDFKGGSMNADSLEHSDLRSNHTPFEK